MIKAAHTVTGMIFFDIFSYIGLKRIFRNVYFKGNFNDNGKPVLLISNHFSWWDGFIQLRLNKKFIHRKFHVMMLENQLRKFKILRNGGAFSIHPGKRNMVESLNYSVKLLNLNSNMLLIFPQGEIQSVYTDYFQFEKGIEYILKKSRPDLQLVFNVNLIDFFSDKKPSLWVHFTHFNHTGKNLREIESAFNHFAENCKNNQKAPHPL